METYIIDIQLESKPIDEVLTSNSELTLDLENLINSDPLSEITIDDIELSVFTDDADALEDEEFTSNDNDSDFLDDINFDLDTGDIFE